MIYCPKCESYNIKTIDYILSNCPECNFTSQTMDFNLDLKPQDRIKGEPRVLLSEDAAPELVMAVKELYYWQYGNNPSNFASMLFNLIRKSDLNNRYQLSRAFPFETLALGLWNLADDDGKQLFRDFGLIS